MHVKDLTEFFQKMIWLICFGVSIREILREKYIKKALSPEKKYCNPVFFNCLHLANDSSKPNNS